mmetsp:Transcript_45586/g.145441  ORF Transcript_45586/g.145441 Transcript_45586/m.145441 type:complete len:92 (+) Transcript_45586:477-752(+)
MTMLRGAHTLGSTHERCGQTLQCDRPKDRWRHFGWASGACRSSCRLRLQGTLLDSEHQAHGWHLPAQARLRQGAVSSKARVFRSQPHRLCK